MTTSPPTRIVDSHQHVYWHDLDDAGLVADLDSHGIEYAWLLTWEITDIDPVHPRYYEILNPVNVKPDGKHTGIPLEDLVRARDRHPDRFVLGYCPHPIKRNAPDMLRSAVGIYDVKVCGEWKFQLPFDDPRCLELFYTAGELKLPVVLHLDIPYMPRKKGPPAYFENWYGGTIDNLERALEACPETTFVGHAPGFWREISADADRNPDQYPRTRIRERGRLYRLFNKHRNLYADLSAGSALYALQRDRANAVHFLKRYANRLLFGRDFYGQDLHRYLMRLKLPGAVLEKIYHRNAESLVSPPG
jgi:predicted TIM-barrel fold metal-dependent hydrolase